LSPDGRWLTVLKNRAEDRERYDLWGFDRTTGQWTMLVDSLKLGSGKELSEAEKMQRERQRIGDLKGIVSYDWTADSKAILVPLEEILETASVVSLHLVPSDLTRRLMNAERLGRMRPDAVLVNTSRSALIDMEALADALKRGRPGWAALDVYDEEPLPADFPLRGLPNVTLTPHLGFVTKPVFTSFARGIVECLEAWLAGQALVRVQQLA
jgi:lactate dehydrogenase-like 2-hydroxyacid dehydrogenase